MSNYTTEVRFICETYSGLSQSVDGTKVAEVIEKARKKIFDFDFPIFDENYRATLETKILKHYYTREIGLETVGLWKLKLDTKLNEIMPYYNKLYKSELIEFNPLYSVNVEKKSGGKGTVDTDGTTTINTTRNDSSNVLNKFSDTPQGTVQNLQDGVYLTNASETVGQNSGSSDNTNTYDTTVTSTNDYLDTIVGYEGIDANDRILKYRKTFLNIDMMVINDLEELFMQLW